MGKEKIGPTLMESSTFIIWPALLDHGRGCALNKAFLQAPESTENGRKSRSQDVDLVWEQVKH